VSKGQYACESLEHRSRKLRSVSEEECVSVSCVSVSEEECVSVSEEEGVSVSEEECVSVSEEEGVSVSEEEGVRRGVCQKRSVSEARDIQ